ncbi:hypothetical protein AOLI_G00192260 [Acnodon oligacanthus]
MVDMRLDIHSGQLSHRSPVINSITVNCESKFSGLCLPDTQVGGTAGMNVKEVDRYWLRKRGFYTGKNCICHGITRFWWNANSDKNERSKLFGGQ